MFYSSTYSSPIGLITLMSKNNQLIGLWLENEKYFANSVDTIVTPHDNLAVFNLTKTWLDNYFLAKNPTINRLPLAPTGSPFRQHVWHILNQIPYGELTTYGDVAKKVALLMNRKTMSSQAVGGAVGHNPISIIIPCHRVVGSNGSLTGYAGGIDKKIKLLELEGVDLTALFTPTHSTAP
ncbi:methylated-DNA--[protein]-cysteine S-methyltransferase [Orbus sasakiae]|uniref:Methylated-DNA--protein-cysteine methyltransferase n=1 Tax=Orbus sasakiae TaxID=1078475 RepID=A0ABP9N2V6_9GAMM